ncbi:MAG: serine/threonine-protein kinase, partial [Planctomycetota bacterium]
MSDQQKIKEIADRYKQDWTVDQYSRITGLTAELAGTSRALAIKILIRADIQMLQELGIDFEADRYSNFGTGAVAWASKVKEDPERTCESVENPEFEIPDTLISSNASATSEDSADIPRYHEPSKDMLIGPYQLVEKIGDGGMGTVWKAQQRYPLEREVALKVIRSGMADRGTIARFNLERQAIALMKHDNIAKILDAGETENGDPFFVMELVDGIPFDRYCDQKNLSISDRLKLMIPICRAVQHAHQKSIIHRDLKHSNILITEIDGKPVPKIIDFGLAKAIERQILSEASVHTEFGKIIGTLEYMSPEQA